MQIFQIQGLFAPFVATLAGAALLLLWRYNRGVKYLPYFAFSLFFFAGGFFLSQVVFEKMTIHNAVASSVMYFTVSGLMVQAALSRLGGGLNIPLHCILLLLDISGRVLILQSGLSSSIYLVYANGMMGIPMAIGAVSLLKHDDKDLQSVFLAVAYASIAAMAIVAPSIILSVGEQVTSENYFSSYYWILLSFLTVFGVCLLILSFAFTVGSDLLRNAEENASKDFLSGLLTRRAFDKEANELLATCTNERIPVGLVMCDIDHFKQINDKFGHNTGDNVITAFGRLLERSAPIGAIAGRTGGEEFAVIMSGVDVRSARLFAEGLRTAISTLKIDDLPIERQITASFGVTVIRHQEPLTSAFKRADEALYEAKNAGRNRVVASILNEIEVAGWAPEKTA